MSVRLRRSDDGFTMVMAVIITAIVFALGGTWLAYADHENSASAHDRRRQHAIDAANAGLVVADAALARNSDYAGTGTIATDFTGGSAQYELSVAVDPTDPTGFRRIITVDRLLAHEGERRERPAERCARWSSWNRSASSTPCSPRLAIATGSSASTVGDMYAGGNITLGNSQDYVGHIYTQGSVTTGSNQQITGDIHAAGTISLTSSSTTLAGSAYAGLNIVTGGTIRNNAQAGGTIGCTKVLGTCSPGSPPAALPVQHLPKFTWNPADYASVTTYTNGAAFVSAVSKQDASRRLPHHRQRLVRQQRLALPRR